jgi:hypothetical protein
MLLLTEDAGIFCKHVLGKIANEPSQSFVTVAGRPVLVEPDPIGRTIKGCPNTGPTIKPCGTTLSVTAGYSTFIRIDGHAVCLDTLVGLTDGTPPGVVEYTVRSAGQTFVSGAA